MYFFSKGRSYFAALLILSLFFVWYKIFLDPDGRLVWLINSTVESNKLFHGVILVSKNGRVIYKKSSSNRPLNEQQFLVASIAKQLTSVLVLKEVEKGNINLFQGANAYLKSHQKIHKEITIHNLLSHTSGIRDNGVLKSGLKFKPGTKYEYSNYAYVILGYILKNVTGRKYDDLASELLQQVGMFQSFFIDATPIGEVQSKHPKLCSSFLLKNGEYSEISKTATRKFNINGIEKVFFANPSGGLVSTATDLTVWNYALHNGKILSNEMYEKMISKVIRSDFPEGFYGYGIGRPSDREISHIGYASGYKSTLSYFPQHQISLVILENITTDDYELDFRMHKDIRNIICNYIKALAP
ncbi:MAG: beta-lactamase family protein [Holosporaceae bacterium]|jgi:CubicO group peptidase (beta-lactamase class C family)|nr:beta-lactamase family protein [Holosporaceae bacterium]